MNQKSNVSVDVNLMLGNVTQDKEKTIISVSGSSKTQ